MTKMHYESLSDLEFTVKSLRQNRYFIDDMSHFLYAINVHIIVQLRIKCLKSALNHYIDFYNNSQANFGCTDAVLEPEIKT